ncbi:gluconate 2-dehydrogenase subunit 3 family protein [Pedobacter nototheniae]|uniref:gluconate 2-dehydrogenase subunit 3 family protein n=1 Tax=Pedobacter nototheniae TaxID=2488994 RepID=UPI0029317CBD|nr:gluconate 2-dehydrogenase subunit 3 family protein [Pedobacter nototheniae]
MNRRDLLKSIALLTSGAVVGADFFLSSFKDPASSTASLLTYRELELLDEVGETILPTTPKSQGAKAAAVSAFIKVIVADCYTEQEQMNFYEGLKQIDKDCEKSKGKVFINCNTAERNDFLTVLDQEANFYQKQKPEKEREKRKEDKGFKGLPNHYFTNIKQAILWAYFSSEVGATEALRYVSVPGHYDGCVPYKKGDRSWY